MEGKCIRVQYRADTGNRDGRTLIPASGNKDPITSLGDLPSFADIHHLLPVDPLKALRLGRKVALGVDQASYAIAAIGCGAARVLGSDQAKRAAFYSEAFPVVRERHHENKLLLHVLMYLYGADSPEHPQYHRASDHSCALQKVCDEGKIAVDDIAQHLATHGGFKGVGNRSDEDDADSSSALDGESEEATERIKRPVIKKKAVVDDDEPSIGDDFDVGGGESDDDVAENSDDQNSPRRPTRKPLKVEDEEKAFVLVPRDYLSKCLVVETPEDRREEIFKALGDGKLILASMKPGKVSASQELYKGGGGFIRLILQTCVF